MQVVLEHVDGGIRASSGGPLDIRVEASDEAGAIAEMLAEVSMRLKDGAKIVDVPLPSTEEAGSNPWLAICGIFANDEQFDEWQEAIEEYRAQVNAKEGPW